MLTGCLLVKLVLLAGLEPANPFGYAILNRARFPTFATGAGSPCLLVKGTDCAGDVLPVRDAVICRSLEAGPCRSALCRATSVGTGCPTYLPRALFSCGPRANRAGGRGSFWCYQTRASVSKWSGSMQETMSLTIRTKLSQVLGVLLRPSLSLCREDDCP